jgi:hypothetical protein
LSKLAEIILRDDSNDGIDRRGFLERRAWAGTGVIWTVSAGVPSSRAFGQKANASKGELSSVQISGSHIGFNKPAPGSAPAPGLIKLPAERLRTVLGITQVQYVARKHSLAVVDSALANAAVAGPPAAD